MNNSMRRSLKSRQIGLVQTYHLISGTATTPVDSGDDSMFTTVEDLGTGRYKITFKDKSRRNVTVAGLAAVTASRLLRVEAVDQESVTIAAINLSAAAADADFYISCVHSPLLTDKF
jgi:hypothetical protein